MSDLLPVDFGALQEQFSAQLAQAGTPAALDAVRVKFLGKKSELVGAMKGFAGLPEAVRKEQFRRANDLKAFIESRLTARHAALASAPAQPAIDVSLPGRAVPQGWRHPVTVMLEAVVEVFARMGFEVAEGPEAEFEYYNFDGLNIPREHPSRENFDTFFLDVPSPDPKKGRLLLRSHTSPVQVRIMERRRPPLRIVVPGRVFRPDALDPSHSFMFHQVEGLLVDDQTTFADLKGALQHFLRELFGPETRTRFRPHFFPFTEPSAEVDIACRACRGKGCPTCGQKGWLEIMGCGMVHPNVLKGVSYDPNKIQGFAFGMGVERIAMLKHGVKDIRLFFENDLRFLQQF